MAIITVRNKKKRIHIMFRWRGIQYNLGTRYYCQRDGTKNCTCKSCHNARLMSQAVQDEIDRDKFKIGEFFPEHTEAQHISILNNNIIFNDFMKDYVENGAFQYSTRKNYRSMVKLMSSHFKSMLITEITRAHVKHYRDWLVRYKTSNKTINNRLGLLSSVFKDAVD
ncbi:MAG: phage integrase N-terminal SAM-like domain-containing protein, partial [Tannerellaceae bacterium]|nr:phage integrase N-terminal SAM-like domain-containing protein [Tannerellaceae bacterium]